MSLDFNVKDVIHGITAKFVQTFLPGAKKSYNAKAVFQPELDIHGIASKASVYNITTAPKVIEEGMNAAVKLIHYLVADGYRISTPLFRSRIRIPGEYNGSETNLPDGAYPEVRMTIAPEFRNYIREHVQITFDGVEETNGFIGEVTDEFTTLTDQVVTPDNIAAIYGYGLKVECESGNENQVGVFFCASDGTESRAKAIAVNEPRTIKVIAPESLTDGEIYTITIRTQTSIRNGSNIRKEIREVVSEIPLIAQS